MFKGILIGTSGPSDYHNNLLRYYVSDEGHFPKMNHSIKDFIAFEALRWAVRSTVDLI